MIKSPSPRYWKVIAALLVIFCAGQGFGYIWGSRMGSDASNRSVRTWTQGWVKQTMTQLERELDLTNTQLASIEPTLQRAGESIRTERRRALFQIHLNILDVHSEIESHLSEDQRIKLDESREKLRRRIQREFPEIMENTSN